MRKPGYSKAHRMGPPDFHSPAHMERAMNRINRIRGWFFTPSGAAWYFGVTYGLTFLAYYKGWFG